MERPLTVSEASKELGYHPDHTRRLLRAGTIKGERVGLVWLIPQSEVQRIKELQSEKGWLPRGFGE